MLFVFKLIAESLTKIFICKMLALPESLFGGTFTVSDVPESVFGYTFKVSALSESLFGGTFKFSDVPESVFGYTFKVSALSESLFGGTFKVSALPESMFGVTFKVSALPESVFGGMFKVWGKQNLPIAGVFTYFGWLQWKGDAFCITLVEVYKSNILFQITPIKKPSSF